MSEGQAPVVGVVEDGTGLRDPVETAVADAGGRAVLGPPEDVLEADPTAVVAVGERALSELGPALPAVPVLPIEAGRGVRSVPADAVSAGVASLLAGEGSTESHPVLSVAVDGESRGTAVMDVSVLTAKAAHISEYDVSADGAALARVRADGIVVATPAGSAGYARRIGGPVIAPGTGVVVLPVAPFATDPDNWVVEPDVVTITPLRADARVELILDEARAGSVAPAATVTCRIAGRVHTAVVPASQSRY